MKLCVNVLKVYRCGIISFFTRIILGGTALNRLGFPNEPTHRHNLEYTELPPCQDFANQKFPFTKSTNSIPVLERL